MDAFVALTGDSNPIHRATSTAPIVPGLLAASLFPAIIAERHPGVLYTRQDLKFVASVPVRAGALHSPAHWRGTHVCECFLVRRVRLAITVCHEVAKYCGGRRVEKGACSRPHACECRMPPTHCCLRAAALRHEHKRHACRRLHAQTLLERTSARGQVGEAVTATVTETRHLGRARRYDTRLHLSCGGIAITGSALSHQGRAHGEQD